MITTLTVFISEHDSRYQCVCPLWVWRVYQ